MIWLVFSLLFLVTIWYYVTKPFSYWKNKGVRQSSPWPIVGDSWRVMTGKTAFLKFMKWIYDQRKGDRYFGFYRFSRPVFAIYDPDLIKQITVKEFDSFMNHDEIAIDAITDPTWGNTVLSLKGQKWKHMRSTVSPSYTGSKMKINYELMVEAADNFINYFLSKNQEYIELEIKDVFARFTNDVIASTAFGLKVDSLKDPNNEFYYHGVKMTNFQSFGDALRLVLWNLAPITWKIFGLKFLSEEQVKFFKNVLLDTMWQREEKNIVRPDLLNVLIEARKERDNNKNDKVLSDEEILAQPLIFFFGGFETISTTLSFGAYELAINKDVQDRLRQEIKETYSKHGKPSFDVIQGMKYMDMVVSEILRKWPVFMVIDRSVTKPFTIKPTNKYERPVKLEPGNVIYIPIFHMQRNPEYFPDPEKFDPERFSDKNKPNINPYTYIPFGSGPRTCIGNRFALLEIKCLLFNILLNFEIVPTKKTQIPPKLQMPAFQYTMDGGYWLGLNRIQT